MAAKFDRAAMLTRLEPIAYSPGTDDEQLHLEQMALGGVLLALAEIHHESEYELCRRTSEHLLGHVNEPEDIVTE